MRIPTPVGARVFEAASLPRARSEFSEKPCPTTSVESAHQLKISYIYRYPPKLPLSLQIDVVPGHNINLVAQR